MNTRSHKPMNRSGSVLIIVLWVALGLVALTLYFANSMTFELRASDNRVSALAADQAIEGGARYVSAVLTALSTNGSVPDVTSYQSEEVPVGDSHFWLIGRRGDYIVQPDQVFFGLVDEGSKLNLNTAGAEMLSLLTNMTLELAANIVDWRSTNRTTTENGDGPEIYSMFQPPYVCKFGPFETVDELRLVYRADMQLLFGEDLNLNGALDPFETDTNRSSEVNCGLLEYLTVYTREPNALSDGTQKINVRNLTSASAQLRSLLQTNLNSDRFNAVIAALGLQGGGPTQGQPPGGPGRPPATTGPSITLRSPLAFLLQSTMTAEEFAAIADYITVSSAEYVSGRVNINTASPYVLACLPGLNLDLAIAIADYRRQNPDKLASIAWIVDALGSNNAAALQALAQRDCITARSYQYSADIAALGPYGRGYRRVRLVFDTSSGKPEIVYRQDLSHLGWALGRYVRDTWLLAKNTR
jgi:type II secretory pathway component PulK